MTEQLKLVFTVERCRADDSAPFVEVVEKSQTIMTFEDNYPPEMVREVCMAAGLNVSRFVNGKIVDYLATFRDHTLE